MSQADTPGFFLLPAFTLYSTYSNLWIGLSDGSMNKPGLVLVCSLLMLACMVERSCNHISERSHHYAINTTFSAAENLYRCLFRLCSNLRDMRGRHDRYETA